MGMIKNGLSVGIEVQIGNNSMDFSDQKIKIDYHALVEYFDDYWFLASHWKVSVVENDQDIGFGA